MKLSIHIAALITAGIFQTTGLQAIASANLNTVAAGSIVKLAPNAAVFPIGFTIADGTNMKLYTIQPSSLQGNQLQAMAAVSFIEKGATDPTFGTIWLKANLKDNGNTYTVSAVTISNLKFPDALNSSRIAYFKTALENKLPQLGIELNKSELLESINNNTAEANLSNSFNNNAPNIIYSNKPAILVLIDGSPSLQKNEAWGVDVVVNSPYTIIKNTDNKYYLFGEQQWFSAPAVTGPYSLYTSYNAKLKNIEKALQEQNADNPGLDVTSTTSNTIPSIIVQTQPAELIQTTGEPNFSPIAGTSLLYADNSSNDIFMDINAQKYYLLLAGRWYQSNGLKQQWNYIDPKDLPTDFSHIPEGSSKDNVLANVAGTDAANEAVLDAQVPQTAKVSRTKTLEQIPYDGNPSFETINGTELSYAVNTATSVLKWKNRYYAVDNGIWYESKSASGPWYVATKRPKGVELIAPSYPVYNVKYVYIYDITPDYIYMGYTPGYLNTYVLGSTIVYGTGYHYRPWQGRYYFPRPWTWGFNMWYNPWAGWSFGANIYGGWFYNSFYNRPGNMWRGSWWGPSHYRPAYGWNAHNVYRNTGYYGAIARNNYARNRYSNGGNNRGNQYNQYNQTNIYINRTNVVSKTNVKSNGRYTSNNRLTNSSQGVTRPNRAGNIQNNNQANIDRGNRPNGNNGNQRTITRPNRVGTTSNNGVNNNNRNPNTIGRPNNAGNGQGTNRTEHTNTNNGTVSRPYNPVSNGSAPNRTESKPANHNSRPTNIGSVIREQNRPPSNNGSSRPASRPSKTTPVNRGDNKPVNNNTRNETVTRSQKASPVINPDRRPSGSNTSNEGTRRPARPASN